LTLLSRLKFALTSSSFLARLDKPGNNLGSKGDKQQRCIGHSGVANAVAACIAIYRGWCCSDQRTSRAGTRVTRDQEHFAADVALSHLSDIPDNYITQVASKP
jgi:hypothetical protein